MTRWPLLLVFLGACIGVVQVEDPSTPVTEPPVTEPPVTEPPVEQVLLQVDPVFVNGDQVGGCDFNPQGWVFIEITGDGDDDVEVHYDECAARVSFSVQPREQAVVVVTTEGALDPAADRAPFEQPSIWYTSEPIGLGDLEAGDVRTVEAWLSCQSFDGWGCETAEPVTSLTVYPTFHAYGMSGGCELDPRGELWVEIQGGGPDPVVDRQVLWASCASPTTYFIEPVETPTVRFMTMEPWANDPNNDAFPMPPADIWFQSEWTTLGTIDEGDSVEVYSDLECVDFDSLQGCL